VDGSVCWVSGFPRKLLALQLEAHAKLLIMNAPTVIQPCIKVRAYNLSKSYSLVFPTTSACSDFIAKCRTLGLEWADARRGGSHELRIKPDRSLSARLTLRLMGSLWSSMSEILKNKHADRPQLRVGSNGPRGGLFVTDGEDLWECFQITLVGQPAQENYEIEPMLEALAGFGVSEEEAKGMIDKAIAVIGKR